MGSTLSSYVTSSNTSTKENPVLTNPSTVTNSTITTSNAERALFLDVLNAKLDAKKRLNENDIVNFEEEQYRRLIQKLLNILYTRLDRTQVGTRSVFGEQLRFNLRHSFPLITGRRIFWRGVVEELLWMISGSTNAKTLSEKGVHIWDGNSTRSFLDGRGLDYPEGYLGPIYGHQWRHWGAPTSFASAASASSDFLIANSPDTIRAIGGIDQLQQAIDTIKNNPTDRRIIVSAWNVGELSWMALPPCHMFYQFYVNQEEKTLSCMVSMRSSDVFHGLPWNISFYSLLTYMVAQICNLTPGELIMNLGDTHIYETHLEQCRELVSRTPRQFPTITLDKVNSIDEYRSTHIHLHGYNPYPAIKAEMAI